MRRVFNCSSGDKVEHKLIHHENTHSVYSCVSFIVLQY